MQEISAAAHSVGALFVLDGVASGMLWVDMEALGLDAYITAPQKGWTSPACAGVVILSPAGSQELTPPTCPRPKQYCSTWTACNFATVDTFAP